MPLYCDPCGEERGWPTQALLRSYGTCEECGKRVPCNDVPTSRLPKPRYKLEDFRWYGGTVLRDVDLGDDGLPFEFMVVTLAAGMIKSGDASGGKEMMAIVKLPSGEACFWPATTTVEIVRIGPHGRPENLTRVAA